MTTTTVTKITFSFVSKAGNRWQEICSTKSLTYLLRDFQPIYGLRHGMLHWNHRAACSIPGRSYIYSSCIFPGCSWLGLINVYKFPLDNFHLQNPSTIIQSSEMPTKS
jgi:hypothetical protein